jgi:hypothetical protein
LNVSFLMTTYTKIRILGTGFFCNKNGVQSIIYAYALRIQHEYVSAGNAKCMCIKHVPFT